MSPAFIRRVVGRGPYSGADVLELLDQDAYRETVIRRSQVLDYLLQSASQHPPLRVPDAEQKWSLEQGSVLDLARRLPASSVQAVVTSPPYWGTRVYDESYAQQWSDGEHCPYGHEQTPEGYIRHTTEILLALFDCLADDGSIWWNVMDSYNTRAPVRSNAVEALRAMEGRNSCAWVDQPYRRYSAGHAYIQDGEMCLIPHRVAEAASRVGFHVKGVITWSKTNTIPDPQTTRVSRSTEVILHLTKQRGGKFNKDAYSSTPVDLGGRNPKREPRNATDVWVLSPSAGRGGHGAQFPLALPGRCVAFSTDPGDVVLDPFMGSGSTGIAALRLGRRTIGFDVATEYVNLAGKRLAAEAEGPH